MSRPLLMGAFEVRAELGWEHVQLHRAKRGAYGGMFPAPLAELHMGAVWDAREIRAFKADLQARAEGKRARMLDALTAYRAHGYHIHPAARELGITPETMRKWLRALGEPLPSELRETAKPR